MFREYKTKLKAFLMSFELSNKIRQTLELILTQWSSIMYFT